MSPHSWSILALGMVGLVLGWIMVLISRPGLRPLRCVVMAAICVLACLLMGTLFEGAWWASPAGLLAGVLLHVAFIHSLPSSL